MPTPAKGGAKPGAAAPTPNPRTSAIEAIAQKVQARYRANTEEAIAEGLTHRDEIEEEDEATAGQEQEQQEVAKAGADQDVDAGGKEAADGTESETEEQEETQAETVQLPANLADKIEIRDGKPVLKTKVNGKVEYKDLEAVVRDLQKYEAGDARLREAAEAKRQVDAERAEFERQKKTTVQLPPGADEQDLDLKSLTKTLLGGTEEEIEAGLKTLVTKVRTPSKAASVDPAELARQIRPIMQAEDFEADRLYGNEQLPIQYPDVYNDPELLAVANVKTAKLHEEHPDWKPSRIILEAAKQAIEWRDSLKAAPAPLANRQGRKERLTSIPGGRSARTTGGGKAPPPTRSQAQTSYVEQLKKQRGQG